MHERNLAESLVRAATRAARDARAGRVVAVRARLGGLQPASPDHLRWHFELAAAGTAVAGARLELTTGGATTADGVTLDTIEVED